MTTTAKTTVHSTRTHTITDSAYPDIEFEVSFEPVDNQYFDSIKLLPLNNNRVAIGYLVQDDSAQDPLSEDRSDGSGRIYSSNRHASNEQHELMQRALGLDSDWQPDIDLIFDNVGNRQLVDDAYIDYFVNNTTVDQLRADGYARDTEKEERLAKEASGTPDKWFQIKCAEHDLEKYSHNMRFEAEYDTIKERFWVAGRNANTIGAPYTVSLDVYEHSGIHYSISGTGVQCQWDTARGGAVWVPDPCCLEHIMSKPEAERQATAIECCGGALREYNAWLCGDVYGVCIAVCDAATGEEISSDECWGYYTSGYAVQTMVDNLKALENVA